MRHHYIPKYYLNGYADLSSGLLWVYERGSQQAFPAGTKRIANETSYYSEEVERYLANEIENPGNVVLRKIRDRQRITEEDKIALSKYMIVMLKRVPQAKERIAERAPEVLASILNGLENELSELVGKYPDLEHLQRKKVKVEDLRSKAETDTKFKSDLLRDTWLKNIPPRTPRSVQALISMTWQFLVHDRAPIFLTSDNPVFFFGDIGIGHKQSEVTFPISGNIALLATWRQNLKEDYVRAKEQYVHQINRRTVSIATRYVFYAQDANWVVKLLNRKKHNLRMLA